MGRGCRAPLSGGRTPLTQTPEQRSGFVSQAKSVGMHLAHDEARRLPSLLNLGRGELDGIDGVA